MYVERATLRNLYNAKVFTIVFEVPKTKKDTFSVLKFLSKKMSDMCFCNNTFKWYKLTASQN